MTSSLVSGLLLGLTAGLAPGPLLTLVITQSLRHGPGEGLKVALAPLVTDLPIVLASLLVLARLSDYRFVLAMVSLFGGGYVGYLAWESMRAGALSVREKSGAPHSLSRGVLVNFLNPHPYLFWMTVGGPLVISGLRENPLSLLLFVIGFYMMLIGSKAGLALAAGKAGNFLQSAYYVAVQRILAGVLAVFAFILFRQAVAWFSGP